METEIAKIEEQIASLVGSEFSRERRQLRKKIAILKGDFVGLSSAEIERKKEKRNEQKKRRIERQKWAAEAEADMARFEKIRAGF